MVQSVAPIALSGVYANLVFVFIGFPGDAGDLRKNVVGGIRAWGNE